MNDNLICFTIGHSRHDIDYFVRLLDKHQVGYVVDVRSNPYSNWVLQQFNRESLAKDLTYSGIEYIYMGDRLGARYTNPTLFINNTRVVDYEKVSRTLTFQSALGRVAELLKKQRKTAIMCSEDDPFECHRFALVSHYLSKRGIKVKHILEGGGLVTNEQLEIEMLKQYNINYEKPSLPGEKTMEQFIDEAYALHNRKICK
ncbi:hypothetical protein AUJ67_03825 [Candidatus Desantisbacteria bacterium CG1_02_49_89]|nr:MAG: hypothetical protein AUJ67_03825 [Candidatus Desantisbacteria bacterium CG1_02_49_89]